MSSQHYGSSPLTRGKQARRPHKIRGRRLIPAHAGKTQRRHPYPNPTQAHPRSRGENPRSSSTIGAPGGSSPLTRGKLTQAVQLLPTPGLIPAHAGKTPPQRPRRNPVRAHPRSRGENLAPEAVLTRQTRLIPAHAGKTPAQGHRPWQRSAHPRSRGENISAMRRAITCGGSSPLTRGKRPRGDRRRRREGLIPAHAGKTPGSQPPWAARPAHPRSRGENARGRSRRGKTGGSSPLTRGKLGPVLSPSVSSGLIPAHAGKTVFIRPHQRPPWAHPRSRGENLLAMLMDANSMGSSPLTRGKRFAHVGPHVFVGLIPAHAGKTSMVGRRSC